GARVRRCRAHAHRTRDVDPSVSACSFLVHMERLRSQVLAAGRPETGRRLHAANEGITRVSMKTRKNAAIATSFAAVLLLTACSGATAPAAPSATESSPSESATTESATGAETEALSGSVVIDGSSTVAPNTEVAAELFGEVQPGVNVSVGVSGTGGGFEKFCNGETDISEASRRISDDEIARCAENGIEF